MDMETEVGPKRRGRKPRSAETRNATSRAAEEREMPQSVHESIFYVDPRKWKQGMTYAWVAVACHNEPMQTNWESKWRNGWRPVPRDRHPDIFPPMPDIGFGNQQDGLIRVGGQILCEMPTDQYRRRRKQIDDKSVTAMNTVASWMSGDQNPLMPRVNQGSTVKFGHSAEFKE